MNEIDREDHATYVVVVNRDEQYSIWPADRELAEGWTPAGKEGTRSECLAYIEEVTTDVRYLLRHDPLKEVDEA